jgi:hypothetical protein
MKRAISPIIGFIFGFVMFWTLWYTLKIPQYFSDQQLLIVNATSGDILDLKIVDTAKTQENPLLKKGACFQTKLVGEGSLHIQFRPKGSHQKTSEGFYHTSGFKSVIVISDENISIEYL